MAKGKREMPKKRREFPLRKICIPILCILLTGLAALLILRSCGQEDASDKTVEMETASASALEEATPEPIPEWAMVLVNRWYPLGEDYKADIVIFDEHENGIDSRCLDPLMEMLSDCEGAGLEPFVCSSFRSYQTQNELYQDKITQYMEEGMNEEEARRLAGEIVAVPGTSEHQLGLAVDIVDLNYQILDEGQEKTEVQKWLIENSWKYGFVLRYPVDKSEITGIVYEPWHYRYVGVTAAKEMTEQGQCLEEYLGMTDHVESPKITDPPMKE